MAPEFAVYSGYQMDRQTFKAFASGLPGAGDLSHSKKRRDFMNYILAFNAWKNQLPPKQKRYVPRFRCTHVSNLGSISGLISFL